MIRDRGVHPIYIFSLFPLLHHLTAGFTSSLFSLIFHYFFCCQRFSSPPHWNPFSLDAPYILLFFSLFSIFQYDPFISWGVLHCALFNDFHCWDFPFIFFFLLVLLCPSVCITRFCLITIFLKKIFLSVKYITLSLSQKYQ